MAINLNPQTREWNSEGHFLKYYRALKSFGAPVDFVRDTARFEDYPVLIVPALQQVDRTVIEKLKAYATGGGNLVMTVRTGHQDKNGHFPEAPFAAATRELMGAEIEFYDLLPSHAPDSVLFNQEKYAWTSWGEILIPHSGTETWATFSGDFYSGKAAVTHRRLGKGTVTYIGVDSRSGALEKELLLKLYGQMKIPVENYPPGVTVEYRDGFGIALNYSDNPYEMKLREQAVIMTGTRVINSGGVLVWKE